MASQDSAANGSGGFQADPKPLDPGLYFVATPIGAARDITLRTLDILANSEVLVAEDTRRLRHLMEIHGVPLGSRRIIAYHDHNGEAARPALLRHLAEGRSVAYASEAGTPLVADPGFQLARAAIAEGRLVRAAPGPSAVLAALGVAGLPTDRFFFAGFLPAAKSARRRALMELVDIPATLIFYESPKRIKEMLADLCEVFSDQRDAVICRELTKRFEETIRGTLGDLRHSFDDRAPKGEFVVLVGRPVEEPADPAKLDAALREALPGRRVKEVATEIAQRLGLPRREVYQAALRLGEEDEN
ncbi:MAG: 16S rRNA (cytidine(1402)-2'-O)-methyltransferase [Pseudorhodobacter sp.]